MAPVLIAGGRDPVTGERLGSQLASARAAVQGSAEVSIPLQRSKRRGDTNPHMVFPRHPFSRWRRSRDAGELTSDVGELTSDVGELTRDAGELTFDVARDRRRAVYERARAANDRADAVAERAMACAERVRSAQDRRAAASDLAQAECERAASHTDELTHVRRRGAGIEQLSQEVERARRRHGGLVVAFVDVDELKRVNDTEGHLAGDALLLAVADCLRGCLRSYDLIMRYGGDEFVCVLPDADAQTVRQRFARVASTLAAGPTGGSITVGFAVLLEADSAEDLIQRADAGLLQARGRAYRAHAGGTVPTARMGAWPMRPQSH